jgi:putative endonuclease
MTPFTWHTYILECSDGTYYTGITTDIERRIEEHNRSPKGAKYTRARRPVVLRYHETFRDKGEALKREMAIKKLKRTAKIKLIQTNAPQRKTNK